MDGTTLGVAVIAGLFGGGLTWLFNFTRARKADREKWENWRRRGYAGLLNRIDEYRYLDQGGTADWQRSYRASRAHVLLSGSKAVSDLLMHGDLLAPKPPGGGRELLSADAYELLVKEMRSDVVPHSRSPRGIAFD